MTRREVLTVFVSPLAYGTAAVFLFIFGIVFVGQFTATKLVEVKTLADPLGYLLPAVLAPALTMRLLAEERRLGTLEMLMTAPVGDLEVVLAKFAGVWIFYATTLALTGLYVCAMFFFFEGSPDWGAFFAGYLGMFLIAGLFLAFGLFVSSCFESPMLAALVAFVANQALMMIGFVAHSPIYLKPGIGQEIFEFLLPFQHYRNLLQGVLDTRDVAYFVLFIAYFLFLATKVLESRKWR